MPALQETRAEDDVEGGVAVPTWDRPALLVVVVLVLVGVGFRIANATQDLFADELATYWIVADHDLEGVVRTVASTAEITPPLSFVLSWITSRAGLDPLLVRLPALLAGIATIPLVYVLGRRTVSREAALLATALTTFSPFMILYSAEARGYGVLMALLVLSTLALVEGVHRGRWGWWVLHGAAACLAMYTHYTSIFVLGVQAAWVLWYHPRGRRAVLLATAGAVVLYLPWLPSLRGDLDSPTTEILSAFSPLSLDMVRYTLGHWSVGFPYAFPTTSLLDLPGLVPLLMLAASLALGLHGRLARSAPAPIEPAAPGGRQGTVLVALLALATPLGTFLQSAASTNVFSVRSLGASWPYLALAAAALVVSSARLLRPAAVVLAVVPFVIGAVTMLGSDFRRPDYVRMARFADDHDAAVVINGAAFPPGPLTQLEVEGSTPKAPVLRLFVPAQLDRPFAIGDPVPDPEAVLQRAVDIADGGPIVVLSLGVYEAEMTDLLAQLPEDYEVTDELAVDGLYLYDLRALAFERDAGG